MKDIEPDEVWWEDILWALGFFAATGYFYWYFTDFENSGDEHRTMNAIFAMLYNIGGKYLVCGITILAGLFFAKEGISKYKFYNNRDK